jgi:eukaryotic-like serine/threonine-protein kinase
MTSPAVIEPRDPLVGTRIDGRYIVIGVLGRGGMGVVYDGMHEQLGRSVAIKVLGPGVAGDANAVQRFLREARIASQLTHGNIVEVSDLGTLPDGRPYLVMAKLAGIDLSKILEKHGPQSAGRTVELLRGAAAALDLVHAKGFVHRDVKPENLMHVVREDGSEAVLLLDFGIVGLVSPDSTRLTAEGVVFGTPCYLAPEVVRGDSPSPASDTYALATVAFELMTGRAPFINTNVMQLLQLKMSQDAPRMSAAAGFRIDPAVESVVATALSRDPYARQRSPGAFIAALAAAIQTGPTDPHPIATGLDPQSRDRLTRGTGELELSFERSSPPEPQTGPTASYGPLRIPGRWRKPRVSIAALCVLLIGSGSIWMLTRSEEPRRAPSVLQPAPIATAAAPTPEPAAPVLEVIPAAKPETVKPTAKAGARTKPATASQPSVTTREATVVPPVSAAALVTKAQDELVQGHLNAAQTLYEQATKADPRNAGAFRGLGLVNERLGKKSAALRAMQRAIALSPNDPKNALLREHIQRLEAAP